jgi:DNA (cytosine-5)-methyltransferase 1
MDLFAGAGGFTRGFVSTGRYEPVMAVDCDAHATATYAANFGVDHVLTDDVSLLRHSSLPRTDVVIGGPPCQGFSLLGRRRSDDPRNRLWRDYVAVLKRARPAFFVLENVPGFVKSEEFRLFREQTVGNGDLREFELETHLLNAHHYGTAQARKRAIVIGRRRGLDPLGPPPRTESPVLADAFPPWVTAQPSTEPWPERRWAPRGHAPVPGAFKLHELHAASPPSALAESRYRAVPPGGSRLDLPEALMTPSWRRHTTGAGDVMGRLHWDRPSVTIRTEFFKPEKGRFLHPDEHRPLTHAEAALIQGFDSSHVWCGSRSSVARQIGNAVPPPLARAVAHLIADRIG